MRTAILAALFAALASPVLAVDPILDDPPAPKPIERPSPPPEERPAPPPTKKPKKRATEKPGTWASSEEVPKSIPRTRPVAPPPSRPPPKPAAPAPPAPAWNQVRLDNTSTTALNYTYKIGNSAWSQFKIPAGIYHMYTGTDRHWISFDDARKHSITYELKRGSVNVFEWRNNHWDLVRKP